MNSRQVDPAPSVAAVTSTCRHKRLVDRILAKNGKETGKVRCAECGAILDDHTPSTVR
jgi:hypothetical protein